MAEETREEKIERLTAEFKKLLESKFPEKGSTLDRIEELTEEIGQEIEKRLKTARPNRKEEDTWELMLSVNAVVWLGILGTTVRKSRPYMRRAQYADPITTALIAKKASRHLTPLLD